MMSFWMTFFIKSKSFKQYTRNKLKKGLPFDKNIPYRKHQGAFIIKKLIFDAEQEPTWPSPL